MYLIVIYLCLLYGGTVFGSSNILKDPSICGHPTCEEPEKFRYKTDTVYIYEYKVAVETVFAGASANKSTLDIKTQVAIQFIKPCEGLLHLKEITITDQDESYPVERAENFVAAVSKNNIRFAFQDGLIMEICPDESEEEWVLNFKRAILALYQNTMKRFDVDFRGVETDIHGTCNVEYTVRGQENTNLIIVKKRDLAQCTNRYKYMSILQTVRYDFQSKFQTWPVLKSESKCRISIDHYVYESVNCRERHLFEPFSNKNSGAMTTVEQNLTLVNEMRDTDYYYINAENKAQDKIISKRSNLLHHHTTYIGDNTIGLRNAREVLKMLCSVKETSGKNSQPSADLNMDSSSTVGLWGRFVKAARPLSYESLSALLSRADTMCDIAVKHILDALPYIASTGSVKLIKDKIVKGTIDKETRHEWLMSMAMIPRPQIQMLESMLELVSKFKNDKVVSFAASSLLHSYCKHSGKSLRECCEEPTPYKIMEIFQNIVVDIVKKDIVETKQDRNNIMIAIKALGNIGGFDQDFAEVLLQIVGDNLMPVPIRLNAVEAFRRTPCLETREYFLETYREDFVNLEVRLASYLQVMRCPDLSTIRTIYHALRHEPVNQAATFVWSHLTNLGKSSLPSRVELQGLLYGNPVPVLLDKPDFRMFSQNYEGSVFFDQYNAGGNYEANVIFSPDSYVPRSLALNLTVDMFGESINVFEMKARAEGFETYFMKYIKEKFPTKESILDTFDDIRNFRFPRSVNDTNDFRKKIDDLGYENEALKHRFPMGDLGIRVFGNEIAYWSAEGDEEIGKILANLNPQLKFFEILSGKEISYNKASLFLDTTFSIPTGCGLPMNMNLMGTSYVNTSMAGTLQYRNSDANNYDFKGKFMPSVAVNVAATMSVTADGLSSSGIRVNWRLYTATAVEAKLTVTYPGLVKLDLSLPIDKQEIFAAKSELIVLHGEKELQQAGLSKNRIDKKTCSWNVFNIAVGIQVCASYQFPNMTNLKDAPYFLMSGPSKYILSLDKADPSANTYALECKWVINETNKDIRFSFDTPDSLEKRMMKAELKLSDSKKIALLTLHSANSTVNAKGILINETSEKSIQASLDVDGHKTFDTIMAYKVQPIKNGYVIIPEAHWIVDNDTVAGLTGSFKTKSKGGVTQCDILTYFQTKELNSTLNGYYGNNGPTHNINLKLGYQFHKNPDQTILLAGYFTEKGAHTERHNVYADLEMVFSAYPQHNFYAVLKENIIPSRMDVDFNISSSRQTKGDPVFKLNFTRIDDRSSSDFKISTGATIRRGKKFVNFGVKYLTTRNKHQAEIYIKKTPYEKDDIIISGFLHIPPGSLLYLRSELNMTLSFARPCRITTKVYENPAKKYLIDVGGTWFNGDDFLANVNYEDLSKTNLVSHFVKAHISSSSFNEISANVRFTRDNRQITFIGDGIYNEVLYTTLIRHLVVSKNNFTTYAEFTQNDTLYNFYLVADMANNTKVIFDLHLDKERDIQIIYSRYSDAHKKEFSAALSWDANRDPTQKLGVDLQLARKGPLHHDVRVALYYPNNAVAAEMSVMLKDWHCEWFLRTSWGEESNIVWKVKMYSEATNETIYALLSSMSTPFKDWKNATFNLIYRYRDNFHSISGNMNWQDDYLTFHLLADYLLKTNEFYGEISADVNSNIPHLPKATAIAKHRVVWKKSADTLLKFQFNNEGKLLINSSWTLDKGNEETNITGQVELITPLKGYTQGFLRTKFTFGHKRDVKGVTYLNLEERPQMIYVDGHMRRLTNCMLAVNVTSPGSDVAQMTARFGFVEADRHLVAMVVTQTSTTGVELFAKLNSLQDFHVFGHLALPIQTLERALVTAKRAPQEVDFRVGWNKMDFGFTAIWHWKSSIDFVYLYKLFTPLEGFEENGLVLKNIYGNGLDTELSIRLSKHKVGIAILLKDKGRGIVEEIKDKIKNGLSMSADVVFNDFDTTARVVLDTLYYPTITFDSRVYKHVGPDEEEIVQANATLHLPNKPSIVLSNVLKLTTLTEFTNTLHLQTPFDIVRELESLYTFDMILNERVNVTCLVLLRNETAPHKIAFKVFYEYEEGEDGAYQQRTGSVYLATPLHVLPELSGSVHSRVEGTLNKMAAHVAMPSFAINAAANLMLDEPFVETSGSLNLTSDVLDDYCITMQFKKVTSESENTMGGSIEITQGELYNYLFADCVWVPDPISHIHFKSRFSLPPVIAPSELSVLYDREDTTRSILVDFNIEKSQYSFKGDQRPKSMSVSLTTPHKELRNLNLVGEIQNDDVIGSMKSGTQEYSITGKVLRREPLDLSLNLIPKGQGNKIGVRLKLEAMNTNPTITAHVTGPFTATVISRLEADEQCTELNFRVSIPQHKEKEMNIKARVDYYNDLRRVVTVQATTPLQKFKNFTADSDFVFAPKTGYLKCNYDFPKMKGAGDLQWSFVVENLFITAIGNHNVAGMKRSVDLDVHYRNDTTPEMAATYDAGFTMDLDRIWLIGGNVSILKGPARFKTKLGVVLPKPNVDQHTVYVDTNMVPMSTDNSPTKTLEAKYETDVTKILTGVKAHVRILPQSFDSDSIITWTANNRYKTIENYIDYKIDLQQLHNVNYTLLTPFYENDSTFALKGSYQKNENKLIVVKGLMHNPGTRQIGEADVRYGGFQHTDGHFNFTTPFKKLSWIKSIFDVNNLEEHSDNKVKLFWPNKTASVNITHFYSKLNEGFKQSGRISLSVPLSAQHLVDTNYFYNEGAKSSNGNATIDLDGVEFAKGEFDSHLTKSDRNLDLITTDIKVENAHTPVGVKYMHEFDGKEKIDVKEVRVFHLHNISKFDVTGKMDVVTYDTGKDLKLTALHGNRTLAFENHYEAFDRELKQGSKIKWTEDTWINYDIHVTNMSTVDTESQQLKVNFYYPRRDFNLVALYNLQDTMLDGKAELNWNVKYENKTAELQGKWENPPTSEGVFHNVELALSHPSFRKDITLNAEYRNTPAILSNVSLNLQYSDFQEEHLNLKSILTDNSNGPIRDLLFVLNCTHPATSLDLEIKSDVNIHNKWYYFSNYYKYQKQVFDQILRHNMLAVDTAKNIVNWKLFDDKHSYALNSTWDFTYPKYTINTYLNRTNGYDEGNIVLSLMDKSLISHFNSSDDISYHLVGNILNTRSVKLDAWRDYDDVTTVDLASYVRLNHSRLLTSNIKWRPEIFGELKAQALSTFKLLYGPLNDTLMTVKETPSQARRALKEIWADAKPRVDEFLNDLQDLQVIKDDLDEFQTFLNTSYGNNDFYVKDIVEFTYHMLDEMAIKNHLESLPGMVNDMWAMMGNTSQSIKQSLQHVVETMKTAYSEFLKSINDLLEKDMMEIITKKLESIITNYDELLRNFHHKLIEYGQAMWSNAIERINEYVRSLMQNIDLTHVLHAVENFGVMVTKKLMEFFSSSSSLQGMLNSDFLTNLATAYEQISYDYQHNSLLTNIKKYSKKVFDAVWDKISPYIPFKDETSRIYTEFKTQWKKFLKTEFITFVRQKYLDVYTRLKWWYDYFKIGEATDTVYEIIYEKLLSTLQKGFNALQYEELHRTPKTNFIFDPRVGEILLEQKLPLSWHSFNSTPDFTDIYEYKVVREFIDKWLITNSTIWSWYYDIRAYMDPHNVLPPFPAIAMMSDQGTLVTYDKKIFTVSEKGVFLLTKDYIKNNFTVLMASNDQGKYDLLVLTANKLVYVDLYRKQVLVGGKAISLPSRVEGLTIVRQLETLFLEGNRGLGIQCDLVYRTCELTVDGSFYATLGGLLGTYNNEQYDELQLPNSTFATTIDNLSSAWRIAPPPNTPSANNSAISTYMYSITPIVSAGPRNDSNFQMTQCEKFFESKVSPFYACFPVKNVTAFYVECQAGVDPCILASIYNELCNDAHVPTHMPAFCRQCRTPQGDMVEEGEFFELKQHVSSTDVVFIVEAQYCNGNITKAKNMDVFIEMWDMKMQEEGFMDNRYAVVGYGGRGLYKRAKAVYVDSQVFVGPMDVGAHLDAFTLDGLDMKRSKTSQPDLFRAMTVALDLPFRPGVPKLFILIPCSNCNSEEVKINYATLSHAFAENSVTVHVLTDIGMPTKGGSKHLFAIDRNLAYTNKDYQNLHGDPLLRKQVKLPRNRLGCFSLAMKSNGTVMSSTKLRADRGTARRFSTVAGGAAARGVPRATCGTRCECQAHRVHCQSCPQGRDMDIGFFGFEDFDEIVDMAMDSH